MTIQPDNKLFTMGKRSALGKKPKPKHSRPAPVEEPKEEPEESASEEEVEEAGEAAAAAEEESKPAHVPISLVDSGVAAVPTLPRNMQDRDKARRLIVVLEGAALEPVKVSLLCVRACVCVCVCVCVHGCVGA